MKYVLDTSVLIDVLSGQNEAIAFLAGLEAVPICSEISRIEVLRGLRSGERQAASRLLNEIDWWPVDEAVANRAGDLGRTWRRSHRSIDTADLAIAATAELSAAPLATTNTRQFPMFEGLERPYGRADPK